VPTPKIDSALAAPPTAGGTFKRPPSRFRRWVTDAEPGRYHVYVSWACPWAHRVAIGRRLLGLEPALGMSVVDPIRDERSWAFTAPDFPDPVNGWDFLSQAYVASDPDYEGRLSVPVLWDKREKRIVNNESSDILRMLTTGFGHLATRAADLYPEGLHAEIDALNRRIYEDLNNAVYMAGFATDQRVYEQVVRRIFATLDELDSRLATRRYLFGGTPVETDWRLFTTLVRFDAVYAIHFKCSLRRLIDYPSLWPYARDLYQQPGIAETVRFDQIREHYYRTQHTVNPSGLVAIQPDVDFGAPHGRAALIG